ncbi:MAG: hypothetical protein ACKVPY_17215, partial [Paracoccaceae bacterium]
MTMMKLRRAVIEGATLVLPLGAIVLLVLGIVHKLQEAAAPLAGRAVHPAVGAVVLLVLLCLLVGLLVRSAPGFRARRLLEATLLEKVPGFRLVKAFAAEGPLLAHQ